MGIDLRLSCSAAGHAWLMTVPEDVAIGYVTRQGIGLPRNYGPNAPTSIRSLLELLDEHRKRGFSIIQDAYAAGMSSMAAPVQRKGEAATGVVIAAGPSSRLTLERMRGLGPLLVEAAAELAVTGSASPLLKSANLGTWGNAADKAPPLRKRGS
ncbi:MAG TPA: IclR family transcriptional regulator C-terminal domain-containing protein [Variovorax sp.]|nr:IclR family transcriptional regulator C-terminal domain-containing protein [Variovorax sp.]